MKSGEAGGFFFFEETIADWVAKLSLVGDDNNKAVLLQA